MILAQVFKRLYPKSFAKRQCLPQGSLVIIPLQWQEEYPQTAVLDQPLMIACQGYYNYLAGHRGDESLNAAATLSLEEI